MTASHRPTSESLPVLPQPAMLRRRAFASLRAKTVLTFALVLCILLVLSAIILQQLIMRGFLQVEQQTVSTDVERVSHAIQTAVDTVDTATLAWSAWDDTYAFAAAPNQAYLDANTGDKWFAQYNINVMIFVNASGQVLFTKSYDLVQQKAGSAPPELVRYLSDHAALLRFDQPTSRHAGIVVLPEGPLLVAARPIVTTAETGPIRGTVVVGRYLDAAKISQLSTITALPFTVSSMDATGGTADMQAARAALHSASEPVVLPVSEATVAGYGLINDLTGRPALLTRLELPRDIYLQGQRQSQYLMLALAVGGLLLGIVILVLIEQLVLRRLITLDTRVARIGASGDLAARVALTGSDELAHLSHSINTMLDTQARIQTERVQLEQARAHDLERTANEQRALVAQLEASLAARDALSRTVQDLSAPVIPVLPGAIVVPLVGVFDAARAAHLQDSVLHAVEHQRVRDVIIDITGMEIADTAVVTHLLATIAALRLLGASTVLVGVRPAIAQTLVQRGVTLHQQKVAADLQTAVMALVARGDTHQR